MSNVLEMARGERLHQEAKHELEVVREQLSQNQARLSDVQERMNAITQRRVAGESNQAEANEFAALQSDAALLSKMLTAAKESEQLAKDKLYGAYVYWTDANAAHQRELAREKFQALQQKTREIEAVFVRALGELGRAGQAIGIYTLGQCFQKSDVLHRALDLNVVPPAVPTDTPSQ